MFVLEVIPLSRTAPPDPLSYRSSVKLQSGTIVMVPLRRQKVPGLVVACIPVQEAKAMLKAAHFALSKSLEVSIGELPPAYLTAAKDIATYHATTLGAVLSALIVPVLTPNFSNAPITLHDGSDFASHTVEQVFNERVTEYKKIISKGSTTLLVVPTLIEISTWSEILSEFKPLVLSSKLTPKRREELIARGSGTTTHALPKLILTTPSFSALPIPTLSHIILERISAGGYLIPKRPYLDLRFAITKLAEARSIPLTYGDYPLPLEYRIGTRPLSRAPAGTITIYDARSAREKNKSLDHKVTAEESEPWHAVPLAVQKEMQKVLAAKGRVAVLAVRRGYSPAVVCRDCGTTVTDELGRVLTYSTQNGERIFRSADGTTVQSTKVLCTVCGSWNLYPLGVGIERVEEELQKYFPDAPIVRIDADSKSSKATAELQEKISTPGTIIIGTEMMLPWLSGTDERSIDLGVIASADSLLAMPFWRARERFVRLGLMIAERTKRTIIVTRRPEDEVFPALTTPTTSTFWKDELALRKLLKFPPASHLLIFHTEGTPAALENLRNQLYEACLPLVPVALPPQFISKTVQKATFVLQLSKEAWPDPTLSERLSSLSPSIRIHIDGEMLS